MRIAIVGAGLAGLCCADALRKNGHETTLFEKSRGVGGRLSTRRVVVGEHEIGFDHGAQYMTVRDPEFRAVVAGWADAGVAAPWPAAGEDAWVGVPGMNTPARHVARALDIRRETRVSVLEQVATGWHVRVEGEPVEGSFDAAILALPAEQAAPMLVSIAPDWSALASDTRSDPCWTVMATFEGRLPIEADSISKRAPIGWAARNSAKPGRGGPEAWVIQADAAWSAAELERNPEDAARRLLDAFGGVMGIVLPPTIHLAAHRWRYAKSGSAKRTALWDADRRLGVCGDWLIGPRVENAFASGLAMARAVAG